MAGRGFRVFPVRPYGKKPAIKQFELLASSDPEVIREWWVDPSTGVEREYNIGVLTNEYVVADIDVKHGPVALEGYKTLGGHFDTFTVQTPTGGYHPYFDGPDSGLRVGVVPGVDIRSHNGYVLGPGSYTDPELANDPDVKAKGWYTIINDVPTVWVPSGIERELRPPGIRAVRTNTGIELDTPTAIDNAAVWLLSATLAIEGQGGDDITYKTAVKLVRDYALSEETAFHLMARNWNARCSPPWPVELLWKKVQNAAEYGQGELGSARPETFFATVQSVPTALQQTARERGVYLGNALEPNAIKPRPWIVERLLLRGDVSVLAAGGAVGKSVLMLTCAAHWALGLDFGPYKLRSHGTPLRILCYNAEDDMEEASRRLLAICLTYKLDYAKVTANLALMDDSQGELILAMRAGQALQINEAVVQYLINTALELNADVNMFDPFVNLHTLQESDNGDMRFLVSILRRIARASKTATFVAHHTAKGAGKKDAGDADAIRGAGAIVNSSRVAVMLSGANEEDKRKYGIKDQDKHSYVRMDDAKANMFARSVDPIAWLRWHPSKLITGDIIGVPTLVDMNAAQNAQARKIAEVLHTHIITNGVGGINRAEAVRVLKNEEPMYMSMCETSDMPLRRLIEKLLAQPVPVGNDRIVYIVEEGDALIKVV